MRQVSKTTDPTERKYLVDMLDYLDVHSGVIQDRDIEKLAEQVETMEKTFKHLNGRVAGFCEDSSYEKNVFVMMRYRDDVRFREVERPLKEQFEKNGLHVFLVLRG